jgi:tRNA A-37 threonylcarbamoyl transferase component Bud32
MGIPHFQIRPGRPDFLDLPWDRPISEWEHERLCEMPTGIHRHPVTFVAYDEGVFVLKELPRRLAYHEYHILRELEERTTRTAEPVGLVERTWLDPLEEQSAVIITQYVEHSFPYRSLVSGAGFGPRRSQMLDALGGLLVELHLAGCFWGDCSLSNVLYRYDAETIEAIMIDGETARLWPSLSDGQRGEDIEIMQMNVAGEMADIAAMTGVEIDSADLSLGEDAAGRYQALWDELTQELVIGTNEGYLIRERIARLNELGFSVDDVFLDPTDKGSVVRMNLHVAGRTFHSERLRQMTGLDASENQARALLSDLNYFLAKSDGMTKSGKSVGIFKWLTSSFEPIVRRISDLSAGDPIQGYCDFLAHRLRMANAQERDVSNDEAFEDWVAEGMPGFDLEDSATVGAGGLAL